MQRPNHTEGLKHVALFVENFTACEHFYTELLGMNVEWRPDDDNVYLTSGNDNLALHRAPADWQPSGHQRLDHIGFILTTPEDVDAWHAFFLEHGVTIKMAPKTHRDGARSFYCEDPEGNHVQMIYHPPISGK